MFSLTRTPAGISEQDLAHLLDQVSMVLRGGIAPVQAWTAVASAQQNSEAARLAQRIALTHQVPPTRTPHLRALGLCLDVSRSTGAGASRLLHELASSLRDLGDAARARQAAFAGPRATARILMALPLVALAMGYALGSDPLGVLFGSAGGLVLLLLGLALTAAGWLWMGRLLQRAAGTPPLVDPSIILDVLAGVIDSGAPLAHALRTVGTALGEDEPGPELLRAGLALSQGVSAEVALRRLDGELGTVRSTATVSLATGAQLAPLLRIAASDLRRQRTRDTDAAASTLGVQLVLPTGVTILPAFIALGIVPIIADLLTTDLGLILGG